MVFILYISKEFIRKEDNKLVLLKSAENGDSKTIKATATEEKEMR